MSFISFCTSTFGAYIVYKCNKPQVFSELSGTASVSGVPRVIPSKNVQYNNKNKMSQFREIIDIFQLNVNDFSPSNSKFSIFNIIIFFNSKCIF